MLRDHIRILLLTGRRYRPKLVRITLGNASNERILSALLAVADQLEASLATIPHAAFKGFIFDSWSASLSRAIAASWSSCSPVQKP
ncbi:MAG: hypothetical protein ACKOCF_01620 [Gammaproteobacteria bacterium]